MISLSAWVLVAIVLVVVALAISVGAAISRARRLDRLHQRIIASREALSRLLLLLSMGEGPRLCVTSRAPPSTTTVTS